MNRLNQRLMSGPVRVYTAGSFLPSPGLGPQIPVSSAKASDARGFTLVELMVAMAIGVILLTTVCLAIGSHHNTLTEQGMSVDMLQSARAALSLMQQDIRMAGYDATWVDENDDGLDDRRSGDLIDNDCDGGSDQADPGLDEHHNRAHFTAAEPQYLKFRLDRHRNADFCDTDDRIGYGFSSTRDRNSDGIADAGAAPIGRSVGASGLQPLAEDLQAVAFGYAFDDDNGTALPDGNIDTAAGHIVWGYDADADGYLDTLLDSNADGVIDETDDLDGDGRINDRLMTTKVPVDRVRAVAIWLLVRTRAPLRGHHDASTYVVGDKIITPADNYKRELVTSIVYCRNLGLR